MTNSIASNEQPTVRARVWQLWRTASLLFVATLASTAFVGGGQYSLGVMSILVAHEFGHFIQARRYRVPVSPPFFLPFPLSPLGTLGAVIAQKPGVANRRQMFDIAITGPLAGLIVALPLAWFGLQQSRVIPLAAVDHAQGDVLWGDPLILQWMTYAVHGALSSEVVIDFDSSPLLFAGWVGIFLTAINLMPVGQLDGGHILHALIGKKCYTVALLVTCGAVCYMAYTRDFGYALLVLLLLKMGIKPKPTSDDQIPLGRMRIVLGWLTLAFVVIGFTPRPMYQLEPETNDVAPEN